MRRSVAVRLIPSCRRRCCQWTAPMSTKSTASTSHEENETESTTHFGFKTVKSSQKAEMVAEVFHNVAHNYDIMNDMMSGSLHRHWKDDFVKALGPRPSPVDEIKPLRMLDVAGGTGDIAFRAMAEAMYLLRLDHEHYAGSKEYAKEQAMGKTEAEMSKLLLQRLPQITVLDINESMLKVGEKRLHAGAVHRFGDGGLGIASSIGREAAGGSYLVPPLVTSAMAAAADAASNAGLTRMIPASGSPLQFAGQVVSGAISQALATGASSGPGGLMQAVGTAAQAIVTRTQAQAEAAAARASRPESRVTQDAASEASDGFVGGVAESVRSRGDDIISQLEVEKNFRFVCADAMDLPFEEGTFDVYTIAFGIRNVTDIPQALREAHRVLAPGGRFMCLEFSQVQDPVLRELYDRYSFNVIPKMGEVIASDRDSYQYLVESIRNFPSQKDFAGMVEDAGFGLVQYTNYIDGVVAIHSGYKL